MRLQIAGLLPGWAAQHRAVFLGHTTPRAVYRPGFAGPGPGRSVPGRAVVLTWSPYGTAHIGAGL